MIQCPMSTGSNLDGIFESVQKDSREATSNKQTTTESRKAKITFCLSVISFPLNSMTQTRIKGILKKIRSLPVRLTQNSLLKIHSSVPVNLTLNSKWRDDGIIELEQYISDKNDPSDVGWSVNVQDGKKLGLSSVDVSLFRTLHSSTVNDETIQYQDITHDGEKLHDIERLSLIATIPEKCNIQCLLNEGGNIAINGKLEAEDGFSFITNGGSITIDKLRGDDIHLESRCDKSRSGNIHVKKSCEAQNLNIHVGRGGRLRAKMLNVSNANVEVQSCGDKFEKLDDDDSTALIDISSIFTSQSGDGVHLAVESSSNDSIDESVRKIRVKSSHGHVSVRSISQFSKLQGPTKDEYGQNIAQVELGGINGSFDISVENNTDDHYGMGSDIQKPPMAAKVHVDSLSLNQANILTSDFGDVSLSLDRKVESDVRFLSTKFLKKLDPNLLLEDDDTRVIKSLTIHDQYIEENQRQMDTCDKEQMISIKTNAFKESYSSNMKHVEYLQGVVENKSQEPDSRFDLKTKGIDSVGKIRIEGAANQALHGFSGGKIDKNFEVNKEALPLLCIATEGKISVESLSWFGAISRRYGIEREQKDLGRQANAGNAANKFKS